RFACPHRSQKERAYSGRGVWRLRMGGRAEADEVADGSHAGQGCESLCSSRLLAQRIPGSRLSAAFVCQGKEFAIPVLQIFESIYEPHVSSSVGRNACCNGRCSVPRRSGMVRGMHVFSKAGQRTHEKSDRL